MVRAPRSSSFNNDSKSWLREHRLTRSRRSSLDRVTCIRSTLALGMLVPSCLLPRSDHLPQQVDDDYCTLTYNPQAFSAELSVANETIFT